MEAYTISLVCEAPVLFTVLVTMSTVLGSTWMWICSMPTFHCPTYLSSWSWCWAGFERLWPQMSCSEALMSDKHPAGALWWQEPCPGGTRWHTCPWPWSCHRACENQPWVVSSCILNANTACNVKCKHREAPCAGRPASMSCQGAEGKGHWNILKHCFVGWGFSAPHCGPVKVCPKWAALTPILPLQGFPDSNVCA